jgi:hypothetical protein
MLSIKVITLCTQQRVKKHPVSWVKGKGKGKDHPKTGPEVPEEE